MKHLFIPAYIAALVAILFSSVPFATLLRATPFVLASWAGLYHGTSDHVWALVSSLHY